MESQGQGQHQEGKRNFNKKKWRETQYSHKQRGMLYMLCLNLGFIR
jgi:hypothetical protein